MDSAPTTFPIFIAKIGLEFKERQLCAGRSDFNHRV